MKNKPAVLRERADQDITEAVAFYVDSGAPDAAARLVDALEKALAHLGRNPASGSPRYAQELGLPGLRSWPATPFPYLVFYLEREDQLDVWRVLHAVRDLPAWLTSPDEP